MRIEALNQFSIIKQGDTVNVFKFKLLDYANKAIDLTNQTVAVIIANQTGKILEKTPTKETETGAISFSFDSEDVTGYGEMRLEIHLTNTDGEKLIIPSEGYYKFVITQNLNDLSQGVTSYSLEYFISQMNEKNKELDEARDAALNAATSVESVVTEAVEAAVIATDQAHYAKEQGDFALEQGNHAATESSNLSVLKTEVQTATTNANNAAASVDTAIINAELATTSANTAASNASTQADYAQNQGNYAKAQGDLVADLLDGGNVSSVNGQTGIVVLDAEDVGAIASNEKGMAGGVALLNSDGKVVDSTGNLVEGKVTSVNGQIGDVTVPVFSGSYTDLSDKPTIPTVTSQLTNDSGFITSAPVTSVNGQTGDIQIDAEDEIIQSVVQPEGIEEGRLWLDLSDNTYQGTVFEELESAISGVSGDLSSHKSDYATFKQNTETTIGTATLQTTNKTLKGAINEVFQAGNNVKSDTVTALLSVDDALPITSGSTWNDVISAIGQISTGKKFATGTGMGTNQDPFVVSGLDFSPSVVYIRIRQGVDGTGSYGENILFHKEAFHHSSAINGVMTSGKNLSGSDSAYNTYMKIGSIREALCIDDGFSVKGATYLKNTGYRHEWYAWE